MLFINKPFPATGEEAEFRPVRVSPPLNSLACHIQFGRRSSDSDGRIGRGEEGRGVTRRAALDRDEGGRHVLRGSIMGIKWVQRTYLLPPPSSAPANDMR